MNQELSGTAGSQFLVAHRADLHRPAAARLERRADTGCRGAARRVRRARRPAGRRHRDRAGDRPGARDGLEPRASTRTCSPSHDADAVERRTTTQLVADPARSAVQPRDRRRPQPARARRSSSSSRRPRSPRASTRPQSTLPNPASYQLPQSSSVVFNAERRHVRSRRHGHDRRRAAAELQHPVRRARRRARRHRDPRGGGEVRLQRRRSSCRSSRRRRATRARSTTRRRRSPDSGRDR